MICYLLPYREFPSSQEPETVTPGMPGSMPTECSVLGCSSHVMPEPEELVLLLLTDCSMTSKSGLIFQVGTWSLAHLTCFKALESSSSTRCSLPRGVCDGPMGCRMGSIGNLYQQGAWTCVHVFQEAGSSVLLLEHPALMTQRMEIGLRLARAELQFFCS